MRSVVDRNVVMRRITVYTFVYCIVNFFASETSCVSSKRFEIVISISYVQIYGNRVKCFITVQCLCHVAVRSHSQESALGLDRREAWTMRRNLMHCLVLIAANKLAVGGGVSCVNSF